MGGRPSWPHASGWAFAAPLEEGKRGFVNRQTSLVRPTGTGPGSLRREARKACAKDLQSRCPLRETWLVQCTTLELSSCFGQRFLTFPTNEPMIKHNPRLASLLRAAGLLSVAMGAATPSAAQVTKINQPFYLAQGGGDVTEFVVDPTGTYVAYRGETEGNNVFELFTVPVNGTPEDAVKINGDLVFGGDVLDDYTFTPDGSRILYLADQETNFDLELYSAPSDGSGPVVKLNPTLVASGDVIQYELTPDGSRVVFLANPTLSFAYELFSAPVDGSAPATKLNTVTPAGTLNEFLITPDGQTVVFRGQLDILQSAVYQVPIDGSAAPVQLSGTMVANGRATQIAYDAFGEQVVYVADQEVDEKFELYSAPLQGGFTPVKLSGVLPANGDVSLLLDDPSSGRVVFAADQAIDEVFDLFGVPADGSSGAVNLTNFSAATNTNADLVVTIIGPRRTRGRTSSSVRGSRPRAAGTRG